MEMPILQRCRAKITTESEAFLQKSASEKEWKEKCQRQHETDFNKIHF